MTKTLKVANGGLVLSKITGRFSTIENSAKLSQDVLENLSIEAQNNGTGCDLDQMVGMLGSAVGMQIELSTRLHEAMDALKAQQAAIQASQRTAAERFSTVARVQVVPIKATNSETLLPTAYAYKVDVISEAGTSTSTTGTLVS